MSQPLSSKENSLFRQVVKFYESKQNKKALKAAEQILKKHPNHGETNAMKALILNSQGKHDEAMALGKDALRMDMKSHVCWHVYGLLWKSERNLEEASKAYKFALKIDPTSQHILRDLALLQVQMRDYSGYIASRLSMLTAKAHFRQNWTALAVAHHLAGNLEEAEKVLTTFEDTLKTPLPRTDLENSEAVLYKNTLIAEMGDTEKALDHLNAVAKTSLDRLAVMELRAKYLLKLGRKEEAEKAYRALIDRNPEYRLYYNGLEQSLGLSHSNRKALQTLYEEYAIKNPRGDAPQWIPLGFLEGDEFRTAADRYLRQRLVRGAPSTFANIKALYKDQTKMKTVIELVQGYQKESVPQEVEESKTTKDEGAKLKFDLSVLYFLAQHYDYHKSRDLDKALELIEQALEKAPKSVEYNLTKARIWKHYGDSSKAAEAMDHGRNADERDRYINSKTAKYQLRDHENEKALETMSKFTRNEAVGGTLGDLHDMQCVWFLVEDGESFLRQRKLGMALKRFTSVFEIFEVWQDDQYDFHTFSFRKGMVRAYVDMIRWEDRLRDQPFYTRAALGAVKAYILLHDHPELAHGHMLNGVNGTSADGDDAAARKKAMKKAKKEQQKKDQAEADKKALEKASAANAQEAKKEDLDPKGVKLLETTKPLEEAVKFISPVLAFDSAPIEAQLTGYELYIRRRKYLLALRCLRCAASIDPQNPLLHEQIIRFRKAIDDLPNPLEERELELVKSSFNFIPDSTTPTRYNDEFVQKHSESAVHVLSAARVSALLDPETEGKHEEKVSHMADSPDLSLTDAREILSFLQRRKSKSASAFAERAKDRWPRATFFGSSVVESMSLLSL